MLKYIKLVFNENIFIIKHVLYLLLKYIKLCLMIIIEI